MTSSFRLKAIVQSQQQPVVKVLLLNYYILKHVLIPYFLMINFLKVELDDHWPRFIISVMEIPILETFDVATDQVE